MGVTAHLDAAHIDRRRVDRSVQAHLLPLERRTGTLPAEMPVGSARRSTRRRPSRTVSSHARSASAPAPLSEPVRAIGARNPSPRVRRCRPRAAGPHRSRRAGVSWLCRSTLGLPGTLPGASARGAHQPGACDTLLCTTDTEGADEDLMASLLEAITVKRKMFFEYREDAVPLSGRRDLEAHGPRRPDARPAQDAQPADARCLRSDV